MSSQPYEWPVDVRTLAVDVGGSGVKGSILSPDGEMLTERVRVPSPYPVTPDKFVDTVVSLVDGLGDFDRVSVGFPALVREGVVHHVVAFSKREYGGEVDPELDQAWRGFDLRTPLQDAFGKPTLVVNDADMQGCAVTSDEGFEFVMTLGTGVGTALFLNGNLLPHLELGHAPYRKGSTFEERLGNVARKEIGKKRWASRVVRAIDFYDRFLFFDRVYLGGGNSKHLPEEMLPDNAIVVPNSAGITGGVKVWDKYHAFSH